MKKREEIPDTFIEKKTKPIIEILKRVVASGYIKNAEPLSCIIVAPIGAGKTTALRKMSINKNILALSDVTPYGFAKLLSEIRGKGITHIVIYDLVEPMSRSSSVVNSLIGFLNSLVEEGIFRISTGFIDIRERIKLGLITCTTENELKDKRRGWHGAGFISRLIPISFNYTNVDVIQILEDLANQKIKGILHEDLNLKSKSIKENPEIFRLLIPYAQGMAIEEAKPFRNLKQLQVLLMANALLRNSDKVTQEDFNWFKSVANYLNYNMNHL